MILVSQGHEKGIGLEVFLKTILRLSNSETKLIKLFCVKETLEQCIEQLGYEYKLGKSSISLFGKTIRVHFSNCNNEPQSTATLKDCLNVITSKDCLVTLPTSKDQLILNGTSCSGYTEYFRNYYNNQYIAMVFKGPLGFTGLLTDHIPLAKVTEKLSEKFVIDKVSTILNGLESYYPDVGTLVFSGINPHCGENGILGTEDIEIIKAISQLTKIGSDFKFIGPLPGDTLHFENSNRLRKMFIYASHDQGLAPFKQQNGLLGINMTFGLPFLRLSVDHGTAFDLYGKNVANANGCHYVILEALKVQHNEHQRN